MAIGSWFRSRAGVTVSTLIFPPAGLGALWMSRFRVWVKLAGTLAVLVIAVLELTFIYGLRLEVTGDVKPIFSFRDRGRHFRELERERAQQSAQLLAPALAQPSPAEATQPAVAAAPETLALREPEKARMAITPPSVWTEFRGPQRDGVYRQGEILTEWPAKGLELLWKHPIGAGYASFIVAEGRAYTLEQRRDREFVVAYDLTTGREIWVHSYQAIYKDDMKGDSARATPTYHDGLIYSQGATGELRVLDAKTGKLKWSKNILEDNQAVNARWGMSDSPLIVDDKVMVQPGGRHGTSVVAYAKLTGAPVWKTLDDPQAHTSPMLVTLAGKRQILTVSAKRAVGLDPETGGLLWEFPWETQQENNCAQPILTDANHFFISAAWGHGAALVEISPSEDGFEAKAVWQNNRMKNRFNSSVLYQGYLYGMDESILACMRVSDGKLMWKGGRYGYGNLLLASGHLVMLTESGELALVKAAPDKWTELAKFEAIEGKTWSSPAIDNGLLLVRNSDQMACFRISK